MCISCSLDYRLHCCLYMNISTQQNVGNMHSGTPLRDTIVGGKLFGYLDRKQDR